MFKIGGLYKVKKYNDKRNNSYILSFYTNPSLRLEKPYFDNQTRFSHDSKPINDEGPETLLCVGFIVLNDDNNNYPVFLFKGKLRIIESVETFKEYCSELITEI